MKTPLLFLSLAAVFCAVPLSAIDLPPRASSRVVPVYPFEYRKGQIEGEVVVTFTVTTRGRVFRPVIEHASHPGFAESVLAAIGKWQFQPGREDDRTVETQVTLPFRFVIPRPSHPGIATRR